MPKTQTRVTLDAEGVLEHTLQAFMQEYQIADRAVAMRQLYAFGALLWDNLDPEDEDQLSQFSLAQFMALDDAAPRGGKRKGAGRPRKQASE